jgi:hypothetical protein
MSQTFIFLATCLMMREALNQFFFFVVISIEPMASCLLGKHPHPYFNFLKFWVRVLLCSLGWFQTWGPPASASGNTSFH